MQAKLPGQPAEIMVRPHELVAIIARLGAGRDAADLGDAHLTRILQAILGHPAVRLRFRTYQGGNYAGRDADAPQGVAQTMLWDLEILDKLYRRQSEARFVVEPAITGYEALQAVAGKITALAEIGAGPQPGAPAWNGMDGVTEADYAAGRARVRGLLAQNLPGHNAFRTEAEMADIRRQTAAAIDAADCLRLYPQHLLFVIAHYGRCAEMLRGEVFAGDSMYEVGAAMRRYPERPVMLVPDHCMLCPTCRACHPQGFGTCGVVPDDLRPAENCMAGRIQLGLLRTLGLEFYQKLPAAEMVKLAFERVPLEHASFAYKGAPPAAWAFARGRQGGMGFLDACADAPGVIARVRKLLESPDVAARLPDADRRHMVKVLEQADGAADARRRYLALIDEHFTYLWKFYCEPAARLAAPLPASIPAERRERDGRPALVARRMDGADGSLDAVAAQWPAAAYSAGFVTIGNRPAIAGTAVGAAFDRDRLYISVLCADRDPAAIRAEYRVGPELLEHQRWSKHFGGLDDSVAFILSASNDPQTCCQFSFNAKGVKAGKILHLGRGRQAEDVWVRETDWRVTAAVENGGWRGTAEIPRACLGDDCNWQAGCRMNVIRFFRNETLFPHVWSALRRDDAALDMHFYETARFGWLETGD